MPYGDYAQCPCCGEVAHGKIEIEELFGYRNIKEKKIIPQAYCRKCRNAGCTKEYCYVLNKKKV